MLHNLVSYKAERLNIFAINSNLKIITSMKAFLGVLIAVILGVVIVDQLRKMVPSL